MYEPWRGPEGELLCSRCVKDLEAEAYWRELATPRVCALEGCDRQFLPGEIHGKYCSGAHRQKAYRERRRLKPAA
jgi:hypothetical protein